MGATIAKRSYLARRLISFSEKGFLSRARPYFGPRHPPGPANFHYGHVILPRKRSSVRWVVGLYFRDWFGCVYLAAAVYFSYLQRNTAIVMIRVTLFGMEHTVLIITPNGIKYTQLENSGMSKLRYSLVPKSIE